MKKIKTIIPLIITFCMNAVVYWGVPLLRTGIKTHNLSGPSDEVIPFMPQFIIIYFGCYLFWVVNYFMASMREEKVKYQFFTADFYARLVCMLCFIFYPTTNTRPVLTGTDIWTQAVRFLYTVDKPINLFPTDRKAGSYYQQRRLSEDFFPNLTWKTPVHPVPDYTEDDQYSSCFFCQEDENNRRI